MEESSVLVVEDDDTIRTLLVEYLRQHSGFRVESVRDGAEALHELSRRHYDVVILDLLMPHMSGIDVLDSLEALAIDPSLGALDDPPAILIVTSEPVEALNDGDIERRGPSFVRGVLRKPFDLCRLAAAVQNLCSH